MVKLKVIMVGSAYNVSTDILNVPPYGKEKELDKGKELAENVTERTGRLFAET